MFRKKILAVLCLILFSTLACSLRDGPPRNSSDGPPPNSVEVNVTANTALTPWLQDAITTFNEAEHKNVEGKQIYVSLTPLEAGQAITEMSNGANKPALWIPDNTVWANLLADQGHPEFQANCVSIAESPLVIAMWRPIAESLGWPGRSLGWLDIGSLAADPSAWAYYSGGQYGPNLRLGHTHPGLSATGVNTMLAIVQAAQSKTEAVSIAEIQEPIVQSSVSTFESTVSWFSPTTANLAQTMLERGPEYLSAAIMYESDVLNSRSNDDIELVPIYPFEGTFVATHPACLNSGLSAELEEGANIFRDYLLQAQAQQLAVTHGLRPLNHDVPPAPPLTTAPGVDLNQPAMTFNQPSVETIYAMQDVWQSARKDVNLVMLLDVSGSMDGDKIVNMRQAAVQFVEQMGDEDYLSLVIFLARPEVLHNHQQVWLTREQIIADIQALRAKGDTALYDSIVVGSELIAETTSTATTNALIVLTDGQDTTSQASFNRDLINAAAANDTTVFTIAYGDNADKNILTQLAVEANGNFYHGTEASIADIYQEMSAAFGGSVGIGR